MRFAAVLAQEGEDDGVTFSWFPIRLRPVKAYAASNGEIDHNSITIVIPVYDPNVREYELILTKREAEALRNELTSCIKDHSPGDV